MRKVLTLTITAGVLLFGLAGGVSASQKGGGAADKMLFENNCGKCHKLDKARAQKKTSEERAATVSRMQKKGAAITDAEVILIANYLSAAFKK
jgi:hypothetical protein